MADERMTEKSGSAAVELCQESQQGVYCGCTMELAIAYLS